MYLCVQDHAGKKLLHHNYPADPQRFLQAVQPFREDLVVGCECMFSWYWLADLCLQERICYGQNRGEITERFTDESVRKNIELDINLIDHYDQLIPQLELYLVKHAKVDDAFSFHLLRSVPGIGKILALVLLYEIHTIDRFASAGDFLSYARLISGRGESAGKLKGVMGRKIGNAHLKWAFAEAACLMIREIDQAKRFVQRLEAKHGKPHALAVLRARIGRAVYSGRPSEPDA
jgi:hypothetical protein